MKIFTPAKWPITDVNWKTIIRELQRDILKYNVIEAAIDGNTTVQHLLGRSVIGWFIIDKDASVDVYRVSMNTNEIVLSSASLVNIKLLVF
jgi:hypothetical protein